MASSQFLAAWRSSWLQRILWVVPAVVLTSTVGISLAQVGGGDVIKRPAADCIMTQSGSCGNKNDDCVRKGGVCSVGGVDGKNGWWDANKDTCGCQL